MQLEGVLLAGPVLQLGFKADFRGHSGRLGVYFGNLTPTALQSVVVELVVPPATQPGLACTAANGPTMLAPRGAAPTLQMISIEMLAPFAAPPYLQISWRVEGSGEAGSACVNLPVLPSRFGGPWSLGKDDFFRLWRVPQLIEAQAKFTFGQALEMSAVKALLATNLKLAVLEGVDPSPNNVCAAGAVLVKNGVAPPAPAGQYALLRLEIIPNYATGADGTPRAASRLTVRATHGAISEALVGALMAHLS